MKFSFIVPNGAPFFSPVNQTGCLLVHGFSSISEEMRWLGDYLSTEGYTVLGLRLAGHGSHPHDLERVRWHDWLADIEDGMENIYAQLADIDKSMLMIDDYDHAIVRDPKRDEVFKTIRKFIDRLANSEGEHE